MATNTKWIAVKIQIERNAQRVAPRYCPAVIHARVSALSALQMDFMGNAKRAAKEYWFAVMPANSLAVKTVLHVSNFVRLHAVIQTVVKNVG